MTSNFAAVDCANLIEASASYNCVIQPVQTTSCLLNPACLISIKSMNHDLTILN